MAIITTPNLVGPETIDTPSSSGPCAYTSLPLGIGFELSPNIFVNKIPLMFYHAASVPAPIPGAPNNPLIPCLDLLSPRKIITSRNKSVYFNKLLPAVIPGDITIVAGKKRILVGPSKYPNLVICRRGK